MADPAEALGVRLESAYDDARRPPERWRRPWSSPVVSVLTVLGALLVGFLLSAGLSAGRDAAQLADSRRAQLIELINARQDHQHALQEQLDGLRDQLASTEAGIATSTPLSARLREAEAAAGLTALTGPGVVLTLGDAAGECPTGREEDCRIQDTDLQLAVNALFAAGAEAVAVNDERVIATTAIRSAGRAILVNYRVLPEPYEIRAIGHSERLRNRFEETDLAADLEAWSEVYGLSVALSEQDELLLPAYSGAVRMRAALPAGDDVE